MPSPLPRRTLADWTPEAGDVTEWLARCRQTCSRDPLDDPAREVTIAEPLDRPEVCEHVTR